jgi:Ca-activated chloride channel family protein
MTLLWPELLLAYLVVPALAAVYLWTVRRRSRAPVRYPTLDLAARAAAAGRPWRRHVPPALYLVTLSGMIFALARPVVPIPVPDNQAAVMLSIDVSGSMESRDVLPSRIEAAKKAAAEFVRALPRGAKVGLVTFSTHATLVTPPTEDHDRVIASLGTLRPEFATAVGDGILEAVYALPGRHRSNPVTRPGDPQPAAADATNLPPAAVVLMSDGGNNTGTPPEQAALVARQLRVTVHTVGLGAPEGAAPDPENHTPVEPLDEQTLRRIASITGGTYHRASSAAELTQAYTRLGRAVGWVRRPVEVSGLASAMSAALLAGTLAASLLWHRLG